MPAELFKKLASYRHVIWDYNGTLIDDVDITCEAINTQLMRYSLSKITFDVKRQVPEA